MSTMVRDTMALALFRRFLQTTAALLLAVHLASGSLVLLALRVIAPRLPWLETGKLMADAWVAALDVTLTCCFAAGACFTVHEAASQRHLLSAAMAGRAPWRVFWPLQLMTLACAPGCWWLCSSVAPQANYHLRFPVAAAEVELSQLLGLVDRGIDLWGMSWRGRQAGSGALADVELTSSSPKAALAVVARRAEVDLLPAGASPEAAVAEPSLRVRFENGRILQRDQRELAVNASFAHLELVTDGRDLMRPDKANLLALNYYRDAELDEYVRQVDSYVGCGVELRPQEYRRRQAVPAVRALRLAAALQPWLSVATMIWLLARVLPARRSTVSVACTAVALGLLARILLEARICKVGDLHTPWLALVPAATTIGIAAACAFSGRGEHGR
jgi:hypothetical protein